MKDSIFKKQVVCPHCDYKMDCHSGVDKDDITLPEKDNISICFNCVGWNKYTDTLDLVKFTEEDINNSDPELIDHLKFVSEELKKAKESNK